MKRQTGFTLIEIAIVLVIIGLLLGGVLKGQEMINNGKVKNMINEMNGIATAVTAYRDRYRGLPGDETANTATARGWAANVGGGNGNGLVGAATADPFTTVAGENNNFWRALRFSGLLTGNPASTGAAALPIHATDGRWGITNTVYGITGNALCASNVPAKAYAAIESQLDDGDNATGSIRGEPGATSPVPTAAAAATTAFDENNGTVWTLCRQI